MLFEILTITRYIEYNEAKMYQKNNFSEICIEKGNKQIILRFLKKHNDRLFKRTKYFNPDIFYFDYRENGDNYTTIDVYKNGKIVRTVYSIYPCVSDQSFSIDKFIVDSISFCVLSNTDSLHYELIKFCDLNDVDLIILFCDSKKSDMKSYLKFLDRTMNSNFLLVNKNKKFFIFDNKIWGSQNKLIIKNRDNFTFCNPKLYIYISKLLKK